MVSRTNLNLHPAEQGRCDSLHLFAPQKEPFFDTKPKCGSNCGQNLRPTRINTGVSADFRLRENSGKSPVSQVQKWGVLGLRNPMQMHLQNPGANRVQLLTLYSRSPVVRSFSNSLGFHGLPELLAFEVLVSRENFANFPLCLV